MDSVVEIASATALGSNCAEHSQLSHGTLAKNYRVYSIYRALDDETSSESSDCSAYEYELEGELKESVDPTTMLATLDWLRVSTALAEVPLFAEVVNQVLPHDLPADIMALCKADAELVHRLQAVSAST